ncbi:hypothetical protein GCM10011328_08760 [Hafnia psychrotolerans]|uniref:Uncharacterized protein n=1 Tax=Hafnia psychrotolerans TaxID=1477018 RepID=A0ABQ1G400_9GAMM|nr:hypothetical protein GCM10011328_08760 [Hafnia psychrotolerans]
MTGLSDAYPEICFGSFLNNLAKLQANEHKYTDAPLTYLRAIAIIRPVQTIPL